MRKRERQREADLVSSATLLGYDIIIIIILAKGEDNPQPSDPRIGRTKKTTEILREKKKREEKWRSESDHPPALQCREGRRADQLLQLLQ